MGTKERVLAFVRITLAVLVLAAVAIALRRNWEAVSEYLREVDLLSFVLASALALVSPVFTLLGWRVLLADLGSRLALPPSASIFFVGQLGKYLPGSVWSVVAQTEMGARLGIPRRRTGVVALLAMGMALLTGILVGLPALPLLITRADRHLSGWWVLLAVLLALTLLAPRLLNSGIALGLRLLRRETLEHELGATAVVATSAWFVAAWLSVGASVVVLAHAVAPGAPLTRLVLAGVCGFALASSVGMFSVVLPAGLGLRDGLLFLLLSTLMPAPAATAVVVISRFLTVVADVVAAALGWAWGRAHHLLGSRA